VRLAPTATLVADGLCLVIRPEEQSVLTSASSMQSAVRETRAALEEIRRHDHLLVESWRCQLRAAAGTATRLADSEEDPRALRLVRALAATAAIESALAARFEARLLRLSGEQLAQISRELEQSFASLRGGHAHAFAHLQSVTEDLLAELRAEFVVAGAGAIAARAARCRTRFAEDVLTAMRAYGERVELLLLELARAADGAVGAPAGGLLPTRESRVPPRSEFDHILVPDADQTSDEVSTIVSGSIARFCARLSDQVEVAIETLRRRLERALQCRALGEQAARDRAEALGRTAQRLAQLAEELDWMLIDVR